MWRSELYPEDWVPPHEQDGLSFLTDSFIQDFSYAGYHRGESPIPNRTKNLVNAVERFGADPSGETDSTEAIQAAIEHVGTAGGGVVYLSEGIYKISRGTGRSYSLRISQSNVVLRGAGRDKTFILNETYEMRQAQVIQVQGSSTSWNTQRSSPLAIVKDYNGPTLKLEVEDTNNIRLFDVGDWIVIWQPATDDFISEINMGPGSDGVSWIGDGGTLRGPRWLRQITSIDENVFSLDAPTRWKIDTRDSPVLYLASDFLMEVGLEDFSIGNTSHPGTGWTENAYTSSSNAAYDTHNSWLIRYSGVTNAWIRRVSSFGPGDQIIHMLSNGVQLRYCRGITLDRVSMTHAQYGGGGGNGYMIRFNEVNESLVVDSEVGFCRHGIVQWRMENSGNVFLRNFDHDTGFQWGTGNGSSTSGRSSDHHGLFSHSNLFDSNVMERSYFQAAYRGDFGSEHGMTASQVTFWNTEGKAPFGSTDYVVHTQQFGQGYVIGTSGETIGVRTSENRSGSASRTDPIDLVEGQGEGSTLAPASLYLDQLLRRIETLDGMVHYKVTRNGDKLSLEWNISPGLKAQFEASDNLSVWAPYIEIPEADGSIESFIPVRQFYRVVRSAN